MTLTKSRLRRGPGALTALIAVSALLATSFTVPAEAREGGRGHRAEAMFDRADANGDGKVTLEEMTAARGEMFSRIDTNGDGLITEAELEAQGREKAKKRAARMLERMDQNGDGAISAEEFAELSERRAGRMFERIDANGDGAIDKAELEEMKSKGRRHGKGPRGNRADQ